MTPSTLTSVPTRPMFPTATAVVSIASTISLAFLRADFKLLMSTAGNTIGPVKSKISVYSNFKSSTGTSNVSDSKVAIIAKSKATVK